MKVNRGLAVIVVLLTSTLACNLSAGQDELTVLADTATAQALTLQAPTSIPGSPTATQFTGVEVSVTSDTNCRTGPSQKFDLVFTAKPGASFKVVGKNTPTGYWIINNPTGGTCWLWGQYAVIKGDPSSLPEYPAPPEPTPGPTKTPKPTKTPEATPTMSAPNAPSDLTGGRTCAGEFQGITPIWRETIWMTWVDNADNEQGYGIYQNDLLIDTISSNSVTFGYNFTYNQGTGGPIDDKFDVEAFNITGNSGKVTVYIYRCP